ncbi:DUF166 domain-containing protein [Verrucomicrobiota bacterium]
MQLLIFRSKKENQQEAQGDYSQEFNVLYSDRVLGNLYNKNSFCSACGPDCTFCRKSYSRSFGPNIAAVFDFPSVLPYVLENPRDYVPLNIPSNDILLAINIHEQILLEILKDCGKWGTKGVVVPLEAPGWVSRATRNKATEICEKNNIEISFPKPFCAFSPPKGSILDRFRKYFHIGCPDVQLTIKDGKIVKADVKVSAACGATYYVAKWLEGRKLDDNIEIEVISKRMHSYPCTASMERDPELNDDTPMHIAGQAHYAILSPHKNVSCGNDHIESPLGIMVQKPIPARESLENVENAKALILEQLKSKSSVTLKQLRSKSMKNAAALNTALLLLKKEGKIKVKGNKICRG